MHTRMTVLAGDGLQSSLPQSLCRGLRTDSDGQVAYVIDHFLNFGFGHIVGKLVEAFGGGAYVKRRCGISDTASAKPRVCASARSLIRAAPYVFCPRTSVPAKPITSS